MLRFDLMKEENEEYLKAAAENNIVEVADAIRRYALYLLCGALFEHTGCKTRLQRFLDEIHRSNMSKIEDGVVLRRADGKVLKGKNYFKPNIEANFK